MSDDSERLAADRAYLVKVVNARMPFGRYAQCALLDLPESYLIWFARRGFPRGELGNMLKLVHEIKLNGLEETLRPLRNGDRAPLA